MTVLLLLLLLSLSGPTIRDSSPTKITSHWASWWSETPIGRARRRSTTSVLCVVMETVGDHHKIHSFRFSFSLSSNSQSHLSQSAKENHIQYSANLIQVQCFWFWYTISGFWNFYQQHHESEQALQWAEELLLTIPGHSRCVWLSNWRWKAPCHNQRKSSEMKK